MTQPQAKIEGLARKRCFHHAAREAAARCPRCQRFFCRECVTEHDGLVICASCLRLATAVRAGRDWLAPVGRALAAALGLAMAAGTFYLLGRLLLMLPAEFHEGRMWMP